MSKMGNFFFKSARQTERSMNPDDRRASTTRYAPESRMIATSTAGLPGSVTLMPRGSAGANTSSTVIYVAPDRSFNSAGEQSLTHLEYTAPAPATLESPLPQTVPPAPQPVIYEAAPKPLPPLDKSKLPVAQRSEVMNRVISPYPPHRELDVSGLPSGSLARDPSVGKIFVLP